MPKNNKKGFVALLPFLMVVLLFSTIFNPFGASVQDDVGYKGLITIIENEKIETVEMVVDGLTVTVSGSYKDNDKTKRFSTSIVNNEGLVDNVVQRLEEKKCWIQLMKSRKTFALIRT